MLKIRHDTSQVRSYAITHPAGTVQLPTQSGWDQILYAKAGLFTARAANESWTVPPHRALCINDGTPIVASTTRPTMMRCLYMRTELNALGFENRVVSTDPLTRHLLLHVVDRCPLLLNDEGESALIRVVIDQLADAPTAPLHLPYPTDERCRALAEAVADDPTLSLTQAIEKVPASRRTLERLFRSETGMTLGGWQRRSRVLASLELLSVKRPITEVAIACGYATSSSFIAAFRSELGTAPRSLLKN